MHVKKIFNKSQLIAEMRKALTWNVDLMRVIGSLDEMKLLVIYLDQL